MQGLRVRVPPSDTVLTPIKYIRNTFCDHEYVIFNCDSVTVYCNNSPSLCMQSFLFFIRENAKCTPEQNQERTGNAQIGRGGGCRLSDTRCSKRDRTWYHGNCKCTQGEAESIPLPQVRSGARNLMRQRMRPHNCQRAQAARHSPTLNAQYSSFRKGVVFSVTYDTGGFLELCFGN